MNQNNYFQYLYTPGIMISDSVNIWISNAGRNFLLKIQIIFNNSIRNLLQSEFKTLFFCLQKFDTKTKTLGRIQA